MDSNEYQHFDRCRSGDIRNLEEQASEFLRLLPHIERENMDWREHEAAVQLCDEIGPKVVETLKRTRASGKFLNETPPEPELLEKMKVLEAHASNAYNKFCAKQNRDLRWTPKCVPAWG